jgi:UPF0176 protein
MCDICCPYISFLNQQFLLINKKIGICYIKFFKEPHYKFLMFKTISFYKYTDIENPELFRDLFRRYCENLTILGRILIGKEGINGAVCGKNEKIELFKKILRRKFPNLTFRQQDSNNNTYHKLVVRLRDEICVFGEETDLGNTGNHLKPEELKQLYGNQDEFIMVDARNDYEYKVGAFKNAIKLPIKNFREFAKSSEVLEPLKNKKLVLYCTGGVRCEKASAYLKEQGFKDVNQLDGGIINYVNQFPNNNEWQGGLFVFDDRLVSDVGETITLCYFCKAETKQYTNCHNLDCDKLFIACAICLKKMNNSCSEICLNSEKRRKITQLPKEIVGVVENYYAKSKIALVRLNEKLDSNSKITIFGKTTKEFMQKVPSYKNHSEDLITFFVKEKVRRNDKVALV